MPMDSMPPVVFDISSDEECWGETRSGGGGGGDGLDWISELFERESEDSDVELVGEVVLNPKPRPNKSSSVAEKPWAKDFGLDDDDDECVILDGDPDKPVMIEKDTASDDSDDLLIVGEKGQIACRDYPHPRHLCAKFPFTSTPHHSHCHLCHCYVCDSLAPCVQWGNATSNMDHCHATDKHEYWKLQRRNFKQGDNAPHPLPQLPSPPPPPQPSPSLLQPKYMSHHVSRPTTIRPCSTSANSSIPNTTNQDRIQQPPLVNSRNKYLPHLVHQQLPSAHSNIHQRDRSYGNLGPRITNSHPIFKRARTAEVASPTYRSGYTSSNINHERARTAEVASTTYRSGYTSCNINHATQYFSDPSSPMAASSNRYFSRGREFSSGMSSDTDACNRYYTRGREFSSGMSSDANAFRAPSLQNTSSRFENSVPSHHQVSPHPSGQGVNSVPPPPPVSSDLNTVPFPQASSSQPNMGSHFEYSAPSQPHEISQPNMGSSFVSPELSQQVYSRSIPVSNNDYNVPQNPVDEFSDFDVTWDNPSCETNQQPLADDYLVQSARVTDVTPKIPVSIDEGTPDFHYESWMLDNQPVSGTQDFPVPSGFDVYSPEPGHIDSSFLFDFESI